MHNFQIRETQSTSGGRYRQKQAIHKYKGLVKCKKSLKLWSLSTKTGNSQKKRFGQV